MLVILAKFPPSADDTELCQHQNFLISRKSTSDVNTSSSHFPESVFETPQVDFSVHQDRNNAYNTAQVRMSGQNGGLFKQLETVLLTLIMNSQLGFNCLNGKKRGFCFLYLKWFSFIILYIYY